MRPSKVLRFAEVFTLYRGTSEGATMIVGAFYYSYCRFKRLTTILNISCVHSHTRKVPSEENHLTLYLHFVVKHR